MLWIDQWCIADRFYVECYVYTSYPHEILCVYCQSAVWIEEEYKKEIRSQTVRNSSRKPSSGLRHTHTHRVI